ncbi:hypothetical protein [Pseudooceanicola algae]|uniref:Uncharacterized protein n=1 Tax=Pseudooceanicola algae TaxID=1537215 RepID=A0A418SI05_9RHOB|nr:hypothetical protein [Pseudooceanicola algae]QPM90244.1 hypothetical protein PSAL_014790 [Pseudooceanicola algae]
MSQIVDFPSCKVSRRRGKPAGGGGTLLAMAHVNMRSVLDLVRCLREMEDQVVLDEFNRAPCVPGKAQTAPLNRLDTRP